jgi:hypothetical protein
LVLSLEQPGWSELSPGIFSGKYFYDSSFDSDYDRVVACAKSARKDQIRIHCLMDDQGNQYGFIAISIAISENKPCLVINYLFVSQQYRSICYPELKNKKIADILIGYAYQIATEARINFPVRYLALVAANEKLETYYSALEFCKLDATNFMYLKL